MRSRKLRFGAAAIAVAVVLMAGCAPRVAHKDLAEDQVGLAALREENVKKVVYGSEVQGFVSTYPLFAEVLNNEILNDLNGYVGRYNVYAREKLRYTETGLSEVDPYLLRASKSSATVRVGIRLLNYIGLRLKGLDDIGAVSRDSKEVFYDMTPEELSLAVQKVRDLKGRLSNAQKRELAKDIVALAADMEVVGEAASQAKGILVEGENLKAMLTSSSYAAELQARDPAKAKLLPEIVSNVNGTLAALRAARDDGEAIVRNARVWKIYLADAMQ